MNKLVVMLMMSTLVMSVVSGLLFFQLSVVETENNELNDELFNVSNLLEEKQNKTLQLEEQVSELQNQTEQLQEEILGLESEISGLESQLDEVENQRDELEEQISNATNIVKITEFKVTGFQSLGGFIVYSVFNLTIENFGITDVKNISVSILGGDDEPPILIFNYEFVSEIPIEVINVDEELKINGRIDYNYQDSIFPVTAKLMLGDIILDEQTVGLSW